MNWRLAAIIVAAPGLLIASYWVFSSDAPPKALVALATLLGIGGAFAALVLLALAYTTIVEDVRPKLRFGKPGMSLALSQKEAALVGRQAHRQWPIRRWFGLTLNSRVFIGLMTLQECQMLRFKAEDEA